MKMLAIGVLCCLVLTAWLTGVSRADCPVTIKGVFFVSLGTTDKLDQYEATLDVSHENRQVAVRLVAASVLHSRVADVTITGNTPACCTVLFPWEPNDSPSVSIAGIVSPDGSLRACTDPALKAPPNVAQTAWRFEDSTIQLGPQLATSIVQDSGFLYHAMPDYPGFAKQQNIGGTALICVAIGPKGGLLASWVCQTSGSQALDQSGMAAAGQSKYREPQVDGSPATAVYIIEYDWTL